LICGKITKTTINNPAKHGAVRYVRRVVLSEIRLKWEERKKKSMKREEYIKGKKGFPKKIAFSCFS